MTTLPTGAQLVAAANVSAMRGLMSDQATAISEMPGGAVATTLTIAAGAVTPTVACHLVDTEAAAASDDLTNIVTTNHPDGRQLLISMVDAARIVTIKHNAGGAGQIALVNGYDLVLKVGGWVELKRTGANWEEVGRSQNLISTVQLSGAVNESYATVASHATTADIWGARGNVINFTGTAVVTAFPAAPQAGVRRRLICAGACSFTSAAGFVVDGGSYTAAAGDVVDVEAVSTSSFKLHPIPVGGVGDMRGANNLAVGAGGVSNAATARTNLGLGTAAVLTSDTDTTLSANSDSNVATQKAVKAYVDSKPTASPAFKNLLIGGSALTNPWQRGTSVALSGATPKAYTADMWKAWGAGASSALTVSQQASGVTASPYCFRLQRTASNTDTGVLGMAQVVETINAKSLQGKTVTLSFQARSGANYSPASSYLVSTISTGTGSDEGSASLIAGTWTGQANTTQNNTLTTSFQTFTQSLSVPSTATEVAVRFSFTPVGTAGANDYFDVLDVQVEVGSSASSFEVLPEDVVLARCLRYYERMSPIQYTIGQAISTTEAYFAWPLKVKKRSAPTLEYSTLASTIKLTGSTGSGNFLSALTLLNQNSDTSVVHLDATVAAVLTAGNATMLFDAGGYLEASSEL